MEVIRCSSCRMDHGCDRFELDRLGRRRKTCLGCRDKRVRDKPGVYAAFVDGLTKLGLTLDILEDDYVYIGGNRRSHANYYTLKCPDDDPPDDVSWCVCGHRIVENCYLRNPKTGDIIVLGSCCIKRYLPNAGRTCGKCGVRHRNRKDDLCNKCRLVQCVVCQESFKPLFKYHDTCRDCYEQRHLYRSRPTAVHCPAPLPAPLPADPLPADPLPAPQLPADTLQITDDELAELLASYT